MCKQMEPCNHYLGSWITCVVVIWPLNAMVRAEKYWMSPDKMEDSLTSSKVCYISTACGLISMTIWGKTPTLGAGGPLYQWTHTTCLLPASPPATRNNYKKTCPQKKLSTTGGVYSSPTDQGNVTTIKLWTSSCKVVWNQHYDLGATQHSKVNVESGVLPFFS